MLRALNALSARALSGGWGVDALASETGAAGVSGAGFPRRFWAADALVNTTATIMSAESELLIISSPR
jgi:hypothetical protein